MKSSMRARPLPSSRPRHAPFGDTAEALHAMRLLLEASVPDALIAETRQFFRMSRAVLLRIAGTPGRVQVWAMDPQAPRRPSRLTSLAELEPIADLQESGAPRCLEGREAAELCASLRLPVEEGTLLLLPIQVHRLVNHVLLLASSGPREFSDEQLEVAEQFAAAVGAGLSRFRRAAAKASESSRQVELSRASKSLNASLDLNRVLVRICEESARILDADTAVLYMGDAQHGLRIEAGTGVGPDAIGLRLGPGEGLAG